MTEFIDALLGLAGFAVLSLGGFAINRLTDWLKLSADDRVRSYLMEGLEKAVAFGQAEARRRLAGAAETFPSTEARDNRAAEMAADLARAYVSKRWPDALRRFGVDDRGLAEMVEARLARQPADTAGR